MKRTWTRFAVLAGCAAFSLFGGRAQATIYRPSPAYQCPYLERDKCERAAAELAQSEPSPGAPEAEVSPSGNSDGIVPAAVENVAVENVAPVETAVQAPAETPVPAAESPVPAAAIEPASPSQVSEDAGQPAEEGRGNIFVFVFSDESEEVEAGEEAIDFEAEVARQAMVEETLQKISGVLDEVAAGISQAARVVDTFDPAPAPPAELTDAAPVSQPVADVAPAVEPEIIEPARAVTASLVDGKRDEWGYARWLAAELHAELHRLAIHEACELAKSTADSIERLAVQQQPVEEATSIEVVAEPESQPAPESATVSVEGASPADVGKTATVEEIPVAQPVTENAQPKSNDSISQPARDESDESSGQYDESGSPESQKPTSYLPETLEDFENGYTFPELF